LQNVRTFQNLVPHLDPSLVKKRPEASVYNAKNMTPILARILGTIFYLYDPSALLRPIVRVGLPNYNRRDAN
jgi:hypothetical protein